MELYLKGVAYVSAKSEGCTLSTGTIVWMSTQTFTLKEFIESGRFCEWRGRHEWEPIQNVRCICYRCKICGKEHEGFLK